MQLTVRYGDTLDAIAHRYGTTPSAIAGLNGIRNLNRIYAGQHLTLPQPPVPAEKPAVPAKKPAVPVAKPAVPAPKPAAPPAQPLHALDTRHPSPARPIAKPAAHPSSALSAADIDALTRAVAAEARGESYPAWMGVAQTIINYSKINHIPVHRLVRSGYLEANSDGNVIFFHLPKLLVPHYDAIRSAVVAASQHQSPIGNRDHFIDNSIPVPSWGNRRTAVRIDHMVFFNGR